MGKRRSNIFISELLVSLLVRTVKLNEHLQISDKLNLAINFFWSIHLQSKMLWNYQIWDFELTNFDFSTIRNPKEHRIDQYLVANQSETIVQEWPASLFLLFKTHTLIRRRVLAISWQNHVRGQLWQQSRWSFRAWKPIYRVIQRWQSK